MKKLLKISLSAVLAALPLMAMAAEKTVPDTNANGPTTLPDTPKYALASVATNDGKLATAGYVKGAYNAAIRGLNTVDAQIQDMKDNLDSNYAKKADVALTIDTAKVDGSFDGASLSNAGFTAAPVAGSVENSVNSGTFQAMLTWDDDNSLGSAAANSVSVAANSVTVGATVNGTISGTVSGSVSNVDVVDHYASTL